MTTGEIREFHRVRRATQAAEFDRLERIGIVRERVRRRLTHHDYESETPRLRLLGSCLAISAGGIAYALRVWASL